MLAIGLGGCGGGGGGGGTGSPGGGDGSGGTPTPPTTYTVGGQVSGLTGSVVLENNGGDDLTVSASGAFAFKTALAGGTGYDVTVHTQPAGMSCAVSGASGTVAAANVTSVQVACAPAATPSLSFSTGAQSVSTQSASGLVTLAALDASGHAMSSNVTVTLASTGADTSFSTTPDFKTTITTVALSGGVTNFYFRGTTAGAITLTATAPTLATATQAETLVEPPTGKGALQMVVSGVTSRWPLIVGQDGNFYGVCELCIPEVAFQLTPAGVKTVIHTFTADTAPSGPLLQLPDGSFAGVQSGSGSALPGALYRLTATGGFSTLYTFTGGADGKWPEGQLVLAKDGNVYGTTNMGGSAAGCGTVYSVSLQGTFRNVYTFANLQEACGPVAGLIQGSDGAFYGTTFEGGGGSDGTVFRVTADGTESVLKRFGTAPGDGEFPSGVLVEAQDGALYGTTAQGGPTNGSRGSVFRLDKDGSGFATLYGFTSNTQGQKDAIYSGTGYAMGTLIQLPDGNLYGTSYNGGTGSFSSGTIYQITPAGSETVVQSFTNDSTGAGDAPIAPLVRRSDDGCLYGIASAGGPGNGGTVFRLCGATP
jgi:uncharacterized repeat protein (TIGR03803 family)